MIRIGQFSRAGIRTT